jgi:hypothetical protein
MRLKRAIAILCVLVTACAAVDPKIDTSSECITLSRPKYASELQIRNSTVRHINATLEWPAEIFHNIALYPPFATEGKIEGLYLHRIEDIQAESCRNLPNGRQSCLLPNSRLATAGFAATITFSGTETLMKVSSAAETYLLQALSCTHGKDA